VFFPGAAPVEGDDRHTTGKMIKNTILTDTPPPLRRECSPEGRGLSRPAGPFLPDCQRHGGFREEGVDVAGDEEPDAHLSPEECAMRDAVVSAAERKEEVDSLM